MKVIAFPFAGGNKYSYNLFKKFFIKKGISLKVLESPGRGRRMNERLLNNMYAIVEDYFSKVLNEIDDEDYVIYGHSMGALTGYLICKKIACYPIKAPLKLIVSGRTSPSMEYKEKIHQLPSDIFWRKINNLGGIPNDLLQKTSVKSLFEPILRSDFKAVEEYSYFGKANLTIPIDVFYGNKEIDNGIDVHEWQNETKNKVRIFKLKGNHFFIFEHTEQIATHIILEFECAPSD